MKRCLNCYSILFIHFIYTCENVIFLFSLSYYYCVCMPVHCARQGWCILFFVWIKTVFKTRTAANVCYCLPSWLNRNPFPVLLVQTTMGYRSNVCRYTAIIIVSSLTNQLKKKKKLRIGKISSVKLHNSRRQSLLPHPYYKNWTEMITRVTM